MQHIVDICIEHSLKNKGKTLESMNAINQILEIAAESGNVSAMTTLGDNYDITFDQGIFDPSLYSVYEKKMMKFRIMAVEHDEPTGRVAFLLAKDYYYMFKNTELALKYINIAVKKRSINAIILIFDLDPDLDFTIAIKYFEYVVNSPEFKENTEYIHIYLKIIKYLYRTKEYELMEKYVNEFTDLYIKDKKIDTISDVIKSFDILFSYTHIAKLLSDEYYTNVKPDAVQSAKYRDIERNISSKLFWDK